ncbi:hypothetical protein ScPMuIL_013833 [Solemya velum]
MVYMLSTGARSVTLRGLPPKLHGSYVKETTGSLAQCDALCKSTQIYYKKCNLYCKTNNNVKIWSTNCDTTCPGTCFMALWGGLPKPKVPVLKIRREARRFGEIPLTWNSVVSPLHTVYILQVKEGGTSNWTTFGNVSSTNYTFTGKKPCHSIMFRVMAINRYGSLGFSKPLQIPAVIHAPGPVTNVSLGDRGLYFNKSADQFMGTIQWHLPQGWNSSDIQFFYWARNDTRRLCPDMSHDALPIMQYREKGFKMLIRISRAASDCRYFLKVRAFSQCAIPGPWTNITIHVPGCQTKSQCEQLFEPPDNVRNLLVVQENRNQGSGCQVSLMWDRPQNLGSDGKLDHFLVRWGRTDWTDITFPGPPEFSRSPTTLELNSSARQLTVVIPDCDFLCTYGFQVIPVAPTQVLEPSELNMFPLERVAGTSKDCQDAVIYEGEDGSIVVIHPAHSPNVEVRWFPMKLPNNYEISKIQAYALQWGAIQYQITGNRDFNVLETTRLPANETTLRLALSETKDNEFGIKILDLEDIEEELEEADWHEAELHVVRVPDFENVYTTLTPDPVYVTGETLPAEGEQGLIFVTCCKNLL